MELGYWDIKISSTKAGRKAAFTLREIYCKYLATWRRPIISFLKFQQLDKAVVNLYDNLTKAQGRKGEAFIRKKKEGLDLLKEAEKCYQVITNPDLLFFPVISFSMFITPPYI